MTKPQQRLISLISDLGYVTVAEQPAGVYSLDIYLPELHCAVEYDGPSHWTTRDIRRDDWLWETFGIHTLRIDAEMMADEGALIEYGLKPFFAGALEDRLRERRQRAKENGWNG